MDVWQCLGIAPTNDPRAIRRAYAEMAKQCHPEENPAEFLRLHAAYESALRQIHNSAPPEPFEPQDTPPAPEPPALPEQNYAFDRLISSGMEEHKKAMQSLSVEVLRDLHGLYRLPFRRNARAAGDYFSGQKFLRVRDESFFVNLLADSLEKSLYVPWKLMRRLFDLYMLKSLDKVGGGKGTYAPLYKAFIRRTQRAVHLHIAIGFCLFFAAPLLFFSLPLPVMGQTAAFTIGWLASPCWVLYHIRKLDFFGRYKKQGLVR